MEVAEVFRAGEDFDDGIGMNSLEGEARHFGRGGRMEGVKEDMGVKGSGRQAESMCSSSRRAPRALHHSVSLGGLRSRHQSAQRALFLER